MCRSIPNPLSCGAEHRQPPPGRCAALKAEARLKCLGSFTLVHHKKETLLPKHGLGDCPPEYAYRPTAKPQ